MLQNQFQKFIKFVFEGILPLLPPADYEEPDPALDYIDPQKRELLDLSFQETTMLKNVNSFLCIQC